MRDKIHLDFNWCLSLDALFTLINGERGVGKTYGFKKWAIGDFIKNGNKFVYTRRYDSEFKKIGSFFNDICNDTDLKISGCDLAVRDGNFLIDGNVAGYYIPLTKAQQYKSTPFERTDKILLDEYIIDDATHHYIKDEVNIFYNLCETIFRMRDFKAFLFANSSNMLNPYNVHFNFMSLPYGKSFCRNKELDAVYIYTKNKKYQETKSNTRFGRAVANTDYGDFANKNIFADTDISMVRRKTDCFYFCTLCIDNADLHFYMSNDYNCMYCSIKKQENVYFRKYTISPEKAGDGVFFIKSIGGNYHLKRIKTAVQHGALYYDDLTSKRYMQKILKNFI